MDVTRRSCGGFTGLRMGGRSGEAHMDDAGELATDVASDEVVDCRLISKLSATDVSVSVSSSNSSIGGTNTLGQRGRAGC